MKGDQTSGSITLDTGNIVAALSAAIEPVLDQINQNTRRVAATMEQLAGIPLDEASTAAVLAHYLPLGGGLTELVIKALSDVQARGLTKAGYVLVATGGPALEAEAARSGSTPDRTTPEPLEAVESPRTAQERAEDEWFDPQRRV